MVHPSDKWTGKKAPHITICHITTKLLPKYGIKLSMGSLEDGFLASGLLSMGVRQGASRASMDAPNVGHNVVSGTK